MASSSSHHAQLHTVFTCSYIRPLRPCRNAVLKPAKREIIRYVPNFQKAFFKHGHRFQSTIHWDVFIGLDILCQVCLMRSLHRFFFRMEEWFSLLWAIEFSFVCLLRLYLRIKLCTSAAYRDQIWVNLCIVCRTSLYPLFLPGVFSQCTRLFRGLGFKRVLKLENFQSLSFWVEGKCHTPRQKWSLNILTNI